MFTLSAYRISADGSVIVGFAIDSEENLGGFRWTAESGFGIAPHNLALGISDDGAYIVGEDLSDSRPYRWSLQGGYEPIGGSGRATAASADGSIIIGDSGLDVLAYAWRWTSASGRQPLGAIPLGPGWDDSTPAAISADGSVIVGSFAGSIAVPTSLAYRWTEQSGYEVLAHFSEDTASAATAVAADGLTILGYTYSDNEPMTPAIWLPDGSVSHLADFLASRAVNFDGWTLRTVAGISDDGLTIAGNGLNPQGTPQGWVAHLQVPCPSDFNNDFNINSQDFFDFLTAYFAGQPTADINHSGHVNTLDFFDFLAAFFTGC
jgi:uncharacterized membrane protein